MHHENSIIDFWRAAEIFEPQSIPKIEPNNKDAPVVWARSDKPLPWQEFSSGKEKSAKLNYQIYAGIFEIKKLREIFVKEFSETGAENFDDRFDSRSAAVTFTVNEKGQPLPETLKLASCAWIAGKTLKYGHQAADWLDGFDRAADDLSEAFEDRMAKLAHRQLAEMAETKSEKPAKKEADSDGGEPPEVPVLAFGDLLEEVKRICRDLNIEGLVEESFEIRVKSFYARRTDAGDEDANDFLNSFYYKDLSRVAAHLKTGNYGAGLKSYLTSEANLKVAERVDLRQTPAAAFRQLSPALIPAGRWAETAAKSLAFSQQIAVNSIWQNLEGDSGLFAVNGPPGTGKTTLLRELIAAVIVERALKLAAYKNPRNAFFSSRARWERDENHKPFTHHISAIKEELKDFGIVVASSNNGAVENISLDIPARGEIADEWFEECEYFSSAATNLTANPKTKFPGAPAWGLIAAKLGNSKNRDDFAERFWFNEISFRRDLNSEKTGDEFWRENWETAAAEFNAARAAEQSLRSERAKLHEQIIERAKLRQRLGELPPKKQILTAQSSKIEIAEREKENELNERRLLQSEASEEKRKHEQLPPSWLEIIRSLGGKRRDWRIKKAELQKSLARLNERVEDAKRDLRKIEKQRDEIARKIKEIDDLTGALERQVENINGNLRRAKAKFGEHFLSFEEWFDAQNEEKRELSAPWSDEEWTTARTRLFAKALRLHEAFIFANAASIRKNLAAFADFLKGRVRFGDTLHGASDVWATFHLVVPLVSTTFASFDKLFGNLKREEIGWLLIDEAGQAVPQAAVGAIWRSRRTIVVGDPLQLEPIVTMPRKMQKVLAARFGAGETWLPANTSVQELADRVNRLGTYIGAGKNRVWVGSPLRVHRRCLKPMFSISNQIAYDNLMVYGLKDSADDSTLPPSCWINVEGTKFEGNWIPAETDEAEKLIRFLIEEKIKPKEIYLVSPFARVARELRKLGENYEIYTPQRKNAGTVHTTQGKQAKIVILVLGGNPKSSGARDWAASKPNLLNVAVSRAQKRLYVIGDREAWRNRRYFSTALNELENYSGS